MAVERIELNGVRYYIEGENVGPSVTTVLKCMGPELSDWYTRMGMRSALEEVAVVGVPEMRYKYEREAWIKELVNEHSGAARAEALKHAEVGEIFHEVMSTGETSVDLNHLEKKFGKMLSILMTNWVDAIDGWMEFEVLETETKIFGECSEGPYGGTIDAIVRTEDERVLLWEIKSSRLLTVSHAVQAAAYANAYQGELDGVYVLRVDKYKKGPVDYREVDVEECMKLFEAAMRIYNAGQEVWKDED